MNPLEKMIDMNLDSISATRELIKRLASEPEGSVAGVGLTCTVIEIFDDSVQLKLSIIDEAGTPLVHLNVPIITEGDTVTLVDFYKAFNVNVSIG